MLVLNLIVNPFYIVIDLVNKKCVLKKVTWFFVRWLLNRKFTLSGNNVSRTRRHISFKRQILVGEVVICSCSNKFPRKTRIKILGRMSENDLTVIHAIGARILLPVILLPQRSNWFVSLLSTICCERILEQVGYQIIGWMAPIDTYEIEYIASWTWMDSEMY